MKRRHSEFLRCQVSVDESNFVVARHRMPVIRLHSRNLQLPDQVRRPASFGHPSFTITSPPAASNGNIKCHRDCTHHDSTNPLSDRPTRGVNWSISPSKDKNHPQSMPRDGSSSDPLWNLPSMTEVTRILLADRTGRFRHGGTIAAAGL